MAKTKLTVNKLLAKSSINDILDEIYKTPVKELAVVFRTENGTICSRWVGDELALTTMAVILAHDIEKEIGVEVESEEDNDS
jgi:hypothetical protein